MASYKSEKLRNVVLLGHGGSGKTSLAEAMLFDTGAVNRLGSVDEGTSVADWDEEERRRKMSINASLVPCEWEGNKLNVIDTPGYMDFIGEVISATSVVESAVDIPCTTSPILLTASTDSNMSDAPSRAMEKETMVPKKPVRIRMLLMKRAVVIWVLSSARRVDARAAG